jgi:dTDP-4-amino-4,6-dideoxygalactose transaminase
VSAAPIPFARPWVTDEDRAAVDRVLRGHILTHGPECAGFEADFAELLGPGAHCVSVSSCMAALHLAYLCLGVGPGDEVVVPAQTHVATAHAVELVGATPVFVDADPATGNVTPAAVAAAVGPRTRAVSVVHYLGIPCDMPGIVEVARGVGAYVVEDCALSIGARWDGVHTGLFGDVGCFSFYPVKHLTSGEGGMFVSRDPELAARAARVRGFGIDRTHTERSAPGVYDVAMLGLNYRMSELQAALGRSQVARAGQVLARRAENFSAVATALADLDHVRLIDSADDAAAQSHYCAGLVLEGPLASRRDAVAARINALGVGTSVYYPHPVPRLRWYRERYGDPGDRYPVATELSDSGISLPVGPHLEPGDAERVGAAVRTAVEETLA